MKRRPQASGRFSFFQRCERLRINLKLHQIVDRSLGPQIVRFLRGLG
jgi:hypothetical protein